MGDTDVRERVEGIPGVTQEREAGGELMPLQPIDGQYTVVAPLVSVEEAKRQWETFQRLTRELLKDSDFQTFTDDEGKIKKFVKKSGWWRLSIFYGVSVRILDERIFHRHEADKCLRIRLPDKYGDVPDCGCPVIGARYQIEARAPNGRLVPGVGLATLNEKRARYTRLEHDMAGKAFTRAVNRAISLLIGGGEGSAEEERVEGRSGLSKEERLRLKEAWEKADENLRNNAIKAMRDLGAVGDDQRGVYTDFLLRGSEEEMTAILARLGVLPFDPDEVPVA